MQRLYHLLGILLLGASLTVIALQSLVATVQADNFSDDKQHYLLDTTRPDAQAGSGVIRVATIGVDVVGCGSVGAPCATVQFAVDQALAGEEIWLAAGTYNGVTVRNGFTQTVYIDKSLTIRGGYSTADGFSSVNPIANPTILDAERAGRVLYISGTVTTALENLTIRNGHTSEIQHHGAGIFGISATLTIDNSTLFNNQAFNGFSEGGALYTKQPLTLMATTFISNVSGSGGGAIYNDAPTTIIDSYFEQNGSRRSVGGALRLTGGYFY
ncbi:MAG: hypothetical protein AAF485_07475 [Chloroflexota bacterium]